MVAEKLEARKDLVGEIWSDRFGPVKVHRPDKIRKELGSTGTIPVYRHHERALNFILGSGLRFCNFQLLHSRYSFHWSSFGTQIEYVEYLQEMLLI